MKIVGRNASDKADVLNPLTGLDAKALSDVALVTKTELVGEAWQGGRNYLCQWLVGHFPLFDELAIRIHERKQKGMSLLIIKGQGCPTFKRAIRLILDCDPSYYFKLRKKYLGGGWQKSLPAEATAPGKAKVAKTSVTKIKVDEPDAKDAEVCDPDPVPMPSDETVDKVHSAASEPESPIEKKEANDWLRTDLRSHLLASFPDLADADAVIPEYDERMEPLKAFLRSLPEPFFFRLWDATMCVEREKRQQETDEYYAKLQRECQAAIADVLKDGKPRKAMEVYQALHDSDWCRQNNCGQRQVFAILSNGAASGLWQKKNDRYSANKVEDAPKPKAPLPPLNHDTRNMLVYEMQHIVKGLPGQKGTLDDVLADPKAQKHGKRRLHWALNSAAQRGLLTKDGQAYRYRDEVAAQASAA
jgi:hypothetical protein